MAIWSENITYDGIDYKVEEAQVLFGTYFFLANQRIDHSRFAYNILTLLSNFGGIKAALLNLFAAIGILIN